ncbi:two-component system regulatory protein YycI [Tepidibacillus marianensis]|uniref:two-component system regulatory protein YycI n=1 Tax=Tepidibacillus marianensis TaxID=3131995 RepID=UPI0030D2DCE4
MDWGKTKTIFILTFFILNLLLGYQIYLKQKEYLQDIQSSNSIQELNSILRLQGIKLTSEIPREIPELHFVQVKKVEIEFNKTLVQKISMAGNGKDYYQINDPIKIEKPYNSQELNSRMKKVIYQFNEYADDPYEMNSNYLSYHQRIEGFPYYGETLKLQLSDEHVIGYWQDYYEVVNQGPNRQVISAYSAIRTILDHQFIPKDSKIQEIQLGYYKQAYPDDIQVFVPVWRMTYQQNHNTGMVYINAMTGGVEKMVSALQP